MKKNTKDITVSSIFTLLYYSLYGAFFSIVISFLLVVLLSEKIDEKIIVYPELYFVIGLIVGVFGFFLDMFLESKGKNILFRVRISTYKQFRKAAVVLAIAFVPIIIIGMAMFNYIDYIKHNPSTDTSNILYSTKSYRLDDEISSKDLKKDYKELNSDVFLGYYIDDDTIFSNYVCFIKEKQLTCLEGFGFDDSTYESNYEIMVKTFGNNACGEKDDEFICSDDEIIVSLIQDGTVSVRSDNRYCEAKSNGNSSCD